MSSPAAGNTRRSAVNRRKEEKTTIDDDGTQVETENKPAKNKKKAPTKRKQRGGDTAGTPTGMGAAKKVVTDLVESMCKTGIQGLLGEFTEIKQQTQAIGSTPKVAFDTNGPKNRYKDVYCVDESRVALTYPPGGDNYIHANWVEVCDGRKYICTQGPTAATIEDFWRMVWQEKCRSIIMLCNILEQGKKKCEQYWPENVGEEMKTSPAGLLTIKVKEKGEYEKLMTLTLLTVSDGTDTHEVEHILWNNWPDRGVPADVTTCMKLIMKVKRLAPTVIHCSAGIGRTGTIVGLDLMYTKLIKGEATNFKEVVIGLRKCRHGSVQMDIQYLYMHRVIVAFAMGKKLLQGDKEKEVNDFIGQYEALCKQRGFL